MASANFDTALSDFLGQISDREGVTITMKDWKALIENKKIQAAVEAAVENIPFAAPAPLMAPSAVMTLPPPPVEDISPTPGPSSSQPNDDFRVVTGNKRRRNDLPVTDTTETSNPFSVLGVEEEMDELPETTQENRRERRPPPIILRNKSRWVAVSSHIAANGFNFIKARNIADGISIQPATSQDYRGITKLLENKEEFHSFLSPEEKPLQVVIRGIPVGIETKDIQDNLTLSGFPVVAVKRMTGYHGKDIPLVKVILTKNEAAKAIFKVTTVMHLKVNIETPNKKRNQVSQCHRCQRFHHAQTKCFARPRCVKCGAEHHTATCSKSKEEPAKCANCQGPHPASYRGCPEFPKPPKTSPRPIQKPNNPATAVTAPRSAPKQWPALSAKTSTLKTATSYAQVTSKPIPATQSVPVSGPTPAPPQIAPEMNIMQLLQLLSKVNVGRLVEVSKKVVAALSATTSPEGTLAALMSVAADIFSLFMP